MRRGRGKKRRGLVRKMGSLLSKQSLAVWPSLQEVLCGCNGVMAKSLYSIFMFDPFQGSHLGGVETFRDISESVLKS